MIETLEDFIREFKKIKALRQIRIFAPSKFRFAAIPPRCVIYFYCAHMI